MEHSLPALLTFVPPLLSAIVSLLGATFCYSLAKKKKLWRGLAALVSLIISILAMGFNIAAAAYGNHLAIHHNNFIFFGEETWGLLILMTLYLLFALFCNVVLWIALALLKKGTVPCVPFSAPSSCSSPTPPLH